MFRLIFGFIIDNYKNAFYHVPFLALKSVIMFMNISIKISTKDILKVCTSFQSLMFLEII